MFRKAVFVSLTAAMLSLASTAAKEPPQQQQQQQQRQKKIARPNVEVVFCLDTTGSMSGLIGAAKQKIWSISNQIASGKPTPRLKIGLVAYRDRGDEYVTRVTNLTDDLDAIHEQVMSFQAAGGGDEPESVNKALADAVTRIQWSTDKSTLKLIFLVGDAPPHMDYNEIQYPEICKKAAQKGIIINTVQCGASAETQRVWKEICRKAEGSYVQIDANGGPVVVITTPYDNALADINAQMAKSTLVYGCALDQQLAMAKAMNWCVPNSPLGSGMLGRPTAFVPYSAAVPGTGYGPPPGYAAPLACPAPAMASTAAVAVAADRASFCASTGCIASYDLLDSIKSGKVKLEDLKKDELPKELRGLNPAEQRSFLDRLAQQRTEMLKKAAALSRQRNDFINRKQAEDAGNRNRDSFDNQVLRILQRQAQRNGIDYTEADEK